MVARDASDVGRDRRVSIVFVLICVYMLTDDSLNLVIVRKACVYGPYVDYGRAFSKL